MGVRDVGRREIKGARTWVCAFVCVCVCVFIELHITAKPGPVKLIFHCYRYGSALRGIVFMCVLLYCT